MIAPLFFVLTALTAAQPEYALPTGKLCVADAPCVATEGVRVRIAASETPRRYVWLSDDRGIVAVGTIASGQTEIRLSDGSASALRISPPVRADVSFELSLKDTAWRWTVPNPPPTMRLLHPPCVDCLLSAEAKGFRTFSKALRDVREVALQPWPHVRGKVTDRATGAPLSGATIMAGGILLGKSGDDGTFDLAVEEKWPDGVDVAFPGRAPLRFPLPRVAGDTEFPPIAMSVGGSLRVTIEPAIAQKATWQLRDPKSRAFDVLREGTIDPATTQLAIDAIGEGIYNFVIRGSRPLQQFATSIEIKDEAVTDTAIKIDPATVRFEVVRGDEAPKGVDVSVWMWSLWRGSVSLDADGRAVEELWQRGKVAARAESASVIVPPEQREITTDEVTWRIEIPDRSVVARVVDAATGVPVPNAEIYFEVRFGDAAVTRWVKTDADGRALFEGVHAGTHDMSVRHSNYLRAEGIRVLVADASGSYPQEIRLQSRSAGRPLSVVDERGAPLSDALVILGDRNGLREIGYTGPDGRMAVPLGREDSGTIFVIPRSGSFAFNRIPPQRGDDPVIEMRVRAGAATIDVLARDPAGKPLGKVLVIARVNGMLLPLDLVDAFMRMQGLSLMTDVNGRARLTGMPPGVYELWAVTGQDQLRALRSAAPPPPAASLEVISGRYEVTLGFASSASASP